MVEESHCTSSAEAVAEKPVAEWAKRTVGGSRPISPKPAPVIVTSVPPRAGPDLGATEATDGRGW